MKQFLITRRPRRFGLGGTLALLITSFAASPAMASTATTTTVNTSGCSAPSLTQPFLSIGDSNWYTLVPGDGVDMFDGGGWTLSGGASIQSTTLADGTTGKVLNLPSGSKAVSPIVCVDNGYQTARTEVRDVVGAEGVQFAVSYDGTSGWTTPQATGQVHGQASNWTLSNPINVQPSNIAGWQLVQFTFVPGGHTSDFQLYDFYVDPRMKS